MLAVLTGTAASNVAGNGLVHEGNADMAFLTLRQSQMGKPHVVNNVPLGWHGRLLMETFPQSSMYCIVATILRASTLTIFG